MAIAVRGVTWIVVCLLAGGVPAAPAAAADSGPPAHGSVCGDLNGRLPASVYVAEPMASDVPAMLRRSAHFRQQCRELMARPWVYVRVHAADAELPNQFSAKSVVLRTAAGPLFAYVHVARRAPWAEWIAHELEHVLEVAEGMRTTDYQRGRGTWESADRVYETTRAIAAGRTVRREMRGPVAATSH